MLKFLPNPSQRMIPGKSLGTLSAGFGLPLTGPSVSISANEVHIADKDFYKIPCIHSKKSMSSCRAEEVLGLDLISYQESDY